MGIAYFPGCFVAKILSHVGASKRRQEFIAMIEIAMACSFDGL